METLTRPEMRILKTGKQFKILKVTGLKGMVMPSHFSSKEAVVIVLKGEAILKLAEMEIHIKANQPAIIPAGELHTLFIQEDFEAEVIMEVDAEIKFEGQN